MAKKSTATRQAAHRPQTTGKQPSVALVRPQRPATGAPSQPATTSGARLVKPAERPAAASRPAATKPEDPPVKTAPPATPEAAAAPAAAPRPLVGTPARRRAAP